MADNNIWHSHYNKLSSTNNHSSDKNKRRVRNLDYKNSILDILIETLRSEGDTMEEV
jgi:hypothetical protein